jgi:hypothetical protein
LAQKIASENNNKFIKESMDYFCKKVNPIEFKENGWVLLKEHNFLYKNKKIAETFK